MGLSYAVYKPDEAQGEGDSEAGSVPAEPRSDAGKGADPGLSAMDSSRGCADMDEDADPAEKDRPDSPQSVLDVGWELVSSLERSQVAALMSVAARGVSWTNAETKSQFFLTLHYGGEVEADGNCLFTSLSRTLDNPFSDVRAGRKLVVDWFQNWYRLKPLEERRVVDQCISNLYFPDVEQGWGVHMVQEVKLLAKKAERGIMDAAINDLEKCGVSRETAAEMVYKERCDRVDDGNSWANYMMTCGLPEDEYDLISICYSQEGLLFVDENRDGSKAAFGDELVLETMANMLNREVYVLQAHGLDGMVSPESSLFFLPHKPEGKILHHPIFLFMKGTGWCGSGGDHYEPIITKLKEKTGEKPVIDL